MATTKEAAEMDRAQELELIINELEEQALRPNRLPPPLRPMYSGHMSVINIQEKFDQFSDQWSPKKIGELNGQQVILAKIEGEFVFHKHDDEDELFMVMKGQLSLELRGHDEEPTTVVVNPGEFFIVPRGVEHKPTAKEETHLLRFEPLSTKHTGDVVADISVETYEEI